MKEKYKISIYDGNRMKIQYNNFNPFEDYQKQEYNRETYVIPTRMHDVENPYLKTKSYVRTLRKKHKELFEYRLNPENCVFLTLTTDLPMY